MYIVFAFLLEDEIHNLFRDILLDTYKKTQVYDLNNNILPHISLKQSFYTDNLEETQKIFDNFFGDIKTFYIEADKFEVINDEYFYIKRNFLWLRIKKDPYLSRLHKELNNSLSTINIHKGLYDGDKYIFHSTLLIGPGKKEYFYNTYNEIRKIHFNKTLKIQRAVMFVCPSETIDLNKIIPYRYINLKS